MLDESRLRPRAVADESAGRPRRSRVEEVEQGPGSERAADGPGGQPDAVGQSPAVPPGSRPGRRERRSMGAAGAGTHRLPPALTRVKLRIAGLLEEHAKRTGEGVVLMDVGFAVHDDPPTFRTPAVAYIAGARVEHPGRTGRGGTLLRFPDLAVELAGPDTDREALRDRVLQYLDAGARAIWVIEPDQRSVVVYRPPRAVRILREQDELTDDVVLPGFTVSVAEILDG